MPKIICFHSPDEPNGYLSNWYPSPFTADGQRYSSMEQYMMHQKALLFGDAETATAILATDNVGKVKALGRSVQNYNDRFWNGVRQIIVYRGLLENSARTPTSKPNSWPPIPTSSPNAPSRTRSGPSASPSRTNTASNPISGKARTSWASPSCRSASSLKRSPKHDTANSGNMA